MQNIYKKRNITAVYLTGKMWKYESQLATKNYSKYIIFADHELK